MNMKQDEPWDITRHTPMPRPKDDDGYFEQMSRAVFLAGLNWKVIEKKITAVVANAQAMQKVEQDFGSFAKYLQAVKARSEDALLKDLHKRFAFLGESTAVIFLFSVGEEMPETLKRIQAGHGTK
jgi:3-methyladenine DNA glycosylase Tag